LLSFSHSLPLSIPFSHHPSVSPCPGLPDG
jgi:hypothetical protein